MEHASMLCPNCGKALPASARFCGSCGAALEQPASDATSITVFISYSRDDTHFVGRLRDDLQKMGIKPWVDQTGITPGTIDWEDALREAIRNSQAVLLIASPHSRKSRYVKDELRIAEYYRLPVFPIWAEGQDWIESIPLGLGGMQYIDARAEAYAAALQEMAASLGRVASQTVDELERRKRTSLLAEPRNPYKGLRAFRLEDSHDFFGRDKLVAELVQALKQSLDAENQPGQVARLLAVVGPSGSGKSSVVMAGLLPALQQGAIPGSEQWVYLDPIVPSAHPLESLAQVLWKRLPDKALRAIREDLEGDSAEDTLHTLTSLLPRRPDARVVVLLDQFEELFTQTIDEHERRHFIDLLATAVSEPYGPVIVLLTLRADFYDRPMQYPELGRLIQSRHRSVLPMDVEDMRSVIEGPAALPDVQVAFEGALVGDLLFEIRGQVGGLPLLQFTLDQLFQRRSGHRLTLAAYQEIGGVRGALAKHAEATYTDLPSDAHRAMARALFMRLIDPGATEQDTTRRRAALKELALADAVQTKIMQETANTFVDAHLLVTDDVGGVTTIEVSHEALIREWPRLADWLHEARDDIRLQRRISSEATEWALHDKPADMLYRGVVLDEAIAWAARSTPNADETAFIQASVEERERQREFIRQQERAELEQQKREAALQRQLVRRQRYVIGGVGAASVILAAALIVTLILGNLLSQTQGGLVAAQNELSASIHVSVTNTADRGKGSLRDAITNAKSGEEITFANSLQGKTIKLTSPLEIRQSMQINGPGASALTISGAGESGVFHINQGIFVTISNLTISDGSLNCTGSGNSWCGGAGIFNEGSLILINSTVSHNKATSSDSSGGGDGGGILSIDPGDLTLSNSTVSDNTADFGAGVFANSYFNTLNSTFSGNSAHANGGAIFSENLLSMTNSTIFNNTASGDGGGIFIADNLASAFIVYCTIYNNRAPTGSGGGVASARTSFSVTLPELAASLIAGNSAQHDPDLQGKFLLFAPNLIQEKGDASLTPNNLLSAQIMGHSITLGPLQKQSPDDQTATLALPAHSIAVDVIPYNPGTDYCGSNNLYPKDQRGTQRPQGNACDLGAVEYVPSP